MKSTNLLWFTCNDLKPKGIQTTSKQMQEPIPQHKKTEESFMWPQSAGGGNQRDYPTSEPFTSSIELTSAALYGCLVGGYLLLLL